jgi:hypothetical protein
MTGYLVIGVIVYMCIVLYFTIYISCDDYKVTVEPNYSSIKVTAPLSLVFVIIHVAEEARQIGIKSM